jgi:hypothetical protein
MISAILIAFAMLLAYAEIVISSPLLILAIANANYLLI